MVKQSVQRRLVLEETHDLRFTAREMRDHRPLKGFEPARIQPGFAQRTVNEVRAVQEHEAFLAVPA